MFTSLAGAIVGVVVALVLFTACGNASGGNAPATQAPPVALPSPTGYYVDPDSPAAQQQREWQAAGRTEDAAAIGRIASQPVPLWLTADTASVAAQAGGYADRAAAVGQKPLFVAYHIPNRDCGSFSSGGAADAADYAAWIRQVASALKGREATVVLEPDAVPHEVSGCVGDAASQRKTMLSDAISVLKAAGPVTVYLDAGNPGFVKDPAAIADALAASGIAQADGFSLNVANFWTTADNLTYGRAISDRLSGKHFIIDTSRNGNGPVAGDTIDGGPTFCNPPGRALGQEPTLSSGEDRVDAYLWVKRVGESDGACRPGELAAGTWSPTSAIELVDNGR
ncbi:glycoside hydrolase family 6 protein [Pseudonocardia sp.]|uniref:glycoside hydrolase family 6 protein n=1 Tax=Pseudonocardia sp. TaxID=60912 RepID=UPI003D0D0FEF